MVCVVVVVGSAVNAAVLVHWVTSRPSHQSPAVALQVTDLFLCILAAPLRYAHAPPIPSPEASNISVMETAIPSTNLTLETPNLLSQQGHDIGLDIPIFSANISLGSPLPEAITRLNNPTPDNSISMAVDANANLSNPIFAVNTILTDIMLNTITETLAEDAPEAITGGGRLAHAAVVCVCLASLHVVVVVAIHRVALLLRCSSTMPLAPRLASPVLVLTVAVVGAASLVGGLHATGNFTRSLPLLGVAQLPPEGSRPPALVVGFLSYVVGLCGITSLCYIVIIAALVHQGRGREVPVPTVVHQPSCNSLNNAVPSPSEAEIVTQGYAHERAVRACMTVVSVLVTLVVCWAVPVTLSLYALVNDASMTPALNYSDALLLLSGLIHPFVYGEGWAAMSACVAGLRHGASTTAYRLGVTQRTRTRVRATDLQRGGGGTRGQGRCCCCWPCTSHPPPPHTQPLSQTACTFVNSFPLKCALPLPDIEQ
ncbi:uncharacterized protein [Procambarus clarkii]|uniref:uncharacterized protein n=1 Tax=Procambarus clarkii TaxID=6728 RepID=UPI00374449CB